MVNNIISWYLFIKHIQSFIPPKKMIKNQNFTMKNHYIFNKSFQEDKLNNMHFYCLNIQNFLVTIKIIKKLLIYLNNVY